MAPLPKPPGQRVRRNLSQGSWRTLPAAEDFKRPPTLPNRRPGWLKATRDWWKTLWASPMASTYVAADIEPLRRLADLVELRNRGKLGGVGLTAMQQLEDRFGLSPKARRSLQWEIGRSDPEEETGPVSEVPKLRVIDGGA
jgi:hypothetical protein